MWHPQERSASATDVSGEGEAVVGCTQAARMFRIEQAFTSDPTLGETTQPT
ncbi:MAG: hypothetical protein R2818_08185 [Flavobacteriales bacterium]